MQWIRALRALNTRLREMGLETRLDGRIGAVDATLRGEGRTRGEGPRTQRTVLRPHRGELWWWLRSPDGHAEAPFLTPLTSAAHPSLAARRIRGLLAPDRG
ncbi:hypothetical protein [Actinorugispora endophytica]|uniref:Uncharacterized protein n=1 Tax=Actinorugispora endophytica TaxID=1605990 RepID=A0A4R6UI75_9ACTN|nr:hypothetical protein [Actinorugispora endophytica]TDQ45756.1 hypothetical protein EV190_12939 [Actinorugispora endophytica]